MYSPAHAFSSLNKKRSLLVHHVFRQCLFEMTESGSGSPATGSWAHVVESSAPISVPHSISPVPEPTSPVKAGSRKDQSPPNSQYDSQIQNQRCVFLLLNLFVYCFRLASSFACQNLAASCGSAEEGADQSMPQTRFCSMFCGLCVAIETSEGGRGAFTRFFFRNASIPWRICGSELRGRFEFFVSQKRELWQRVKVERERV